MALFSSVFGPKLFGVVDLVVLVPLLLVVAISSQNHEFIKIDKYVLFLTGVSAFIYFQLLLFNISAHLEDTHFLLRNFRALLSQVFIFIFFYSITRQGLISHEKVFKLITAAFLVCAFVVYLQAFFPNTQVIFADLWGFNKPFRYLRAFGLSAGYDSTGYLLCWGAAFILLRWLRFRRKSSLFPFIFIAGAVLFTSRTSMIMLIGICALSIIISIRYYRILSFSSMAIVSVGLFFIKFFIYPIIAASIFGGDVDESVFVRNVSDRFATTDIAATAADHYIVPDTFFEVVFGVGIDPLVDPGYTITIFRGGLLLLFTFLLFYWLSLMYVRKVYKSTKQCLGMHQSRWVGLWVAAIFLVFVIIVIGNFKNLYFFSRGYHELFVLLVAVALGFCHRAKVGSMNSVVAK
jgi:hypothetical protein